MKLVFGFRRILKLTIFVVPLIALCFMSVNIFLGFLKPWNESIEALNQQYPDKLSILISKSSGLVFIGDSEVPVNYIEEKRLVPSLNVTVRVLKLGSSKAEIQESKGGILSLVITIVTLLGCIYASTKIKLNLQE